MNGYIVCRTQIYVQIEIYSLKLPKEIASPLQHFPTLSFMRLLDSIFFTKCFEYLPCATPFRRDFFMSPSIASLIKCFSISAPHSLPLQPTDLLICQQVLHSFDAPGTVLHARDSMANGTDVSPASMQLPIQRTYLFSSSILLLPRKH